MSMFRRIAVVALLLVPACESTAPFVSVATTLSVNPGTASLTALGATRQFTAVVLDQKGDTMSNAGVQWGTVNSGVATVDNAGLLTAQGVGSTQVQATLTAGSNTLSSNAAVTVSQVPRRLVKVSGDFQTDTTGGTLQAPIVVRVEDSLAHPIPGIPLAFAVTLGGGNTTPQADTTDASGLASTTWTVGASSGANTLSASVTASGVTGNPASFSASAVVAGTVPSVVQFAGDGQTGLIGFPVNVAPAVLVLTGGGAPISGETVVFTITGGGGSLSGGTAITDANGVARVGSWTLASGANSLSAVVQDTLTVTGNPVAFTATGAPKSYHIDVRFLSTMSASQQATFTNAANRWEELIFGDVPDLPVSIPAGSCGAGTPALNETIDDIIIFASIDSIDGLGKILGRAGPCGVRGGTKFTFLGVMEFDSADVATLEAGGQLGLVIMHEMGHVLGFGILWSGLLAGGGGSDPHFVGTQAVAAFDRVGGTAYAGTKVPVENTGGSGTRDAHWRESVLKNELMTGFLNLGTNPISIVSTASLGDLGYLVNYAGSDSYFLTLPLVAQPETVIPLGDDILRIPMMEIDATGRIVRVIMPPP
jgi:hypothetical protein